MPQHPSSSAWLGAIATLFVLAALHGYVTWRLCAERSGEVSQTIKPRTVGLLVLAFVNPLLPFTALVLLLLAYRSFVQGASQASQYH
jgi:hypothetical protein